jgi:hypothetical protein
VRSVTIIKSLAAASTNIVALAQTPAVGGYAVLNGAAAASLPLGAFGAMTTVAVLDTQRRLYFTSAGNDSANTAIITGLNENGGQIREILTLGNAAAVVSNLDYKVVLSIQFPTGTAGLIMVGTFTTGSTDWYVPNYNLTPFVMQFTTEGSGTIFWNLETTNDLNFFAPPSGSNAPNPVVNVTTFVANGTLGVPITLNSPVTGWRFTITQGTGVLSAQATQAGITNM